jgi:hypothetical protein
VTLREVPFDKLGKKVAVFAGSTFANEKIRVRLATIASSIEHIEMRQTKGVDASRELGMIRCWHFVLFCQTPRHPDTAWLERILATALDQSTFRAVQYEPKLL